jgi:hypothetical protein
MWLPGSDKSPNYEYAIPLLLRTPQSAKTRKRDRDRPEALRLAPVRFESTLFPGQKIVVSIPGRAEAKAQTTEFLRQGDRFLVETRPVQTEPREPD